MPSRRRIKPNQNKKKKSSAVVQRKRRKAAIRRNAKPKESEGQLFEKLVALQARLRGPGGCPWDREQTPETLRTFLIEEAYESLDALEGGDPRKFADELGDLMLQIIFHSLLAKEKGQFQIEDVIRSVHDKMVRRHPHVFGNVKAGTPAEVLKNWEQLKAQERKQEAGAGKGTAAQAPPSALSVVPKNLPALIEAYQLTRRAAKVGFDWDNIAGILDKLEEETKELRAALDAADHKQLEEETGDLLFVLVNVARFLGIDPEIALKGTNRKFKARFEWMEHAANRLGSTFAELPRDKKEALWDEAKKDGNAAKVVF